MPTDPATVPPLTDAEAADLVYAHCPTLRSEGKSVTAGWWVADVARAAYALAASRVNLHAVRATSWDDGYDAARAKYQSVDTAEVERRAARKALAECAAWLGKGESQPVRFDEDGRFLLAFERVNAFSDRYLAREHPAPAPRECVPTLADLVEECNATKSDDGRPFERAVVAALDAIAVRVARLAAVVGQ